VALVVIARGSVAGWGKALLGSTKLKLVGEQKDQWVHMMG
jgi:hypothetical protein